MATDNEARALGFTTPRGADQVRYGDDAISNNARVATDHVRMLTGRVTDLEKRPGRPGPQGPPGPPGDQPNYYSLLLMLRQVQAGHLRTLWIGDSNTEDVTATSRATTLPQRVTAALRARYFPGGAGDQGVGYVPAAGYVYPATGAGTEVAAGGMDRRAIKLAAGQTRTWPAATARYITVYWTSSIFARGVAEVLVDGTVVGTIDASAGTEHKPGQVWRYDAGSVATRTVAVRGKSGSYFTVEGVSFQTSTTAGVSVWAAGRSGSRVKDYADDDQWAPSIASVDPGLVVAGFGGNDMAPDADWGKGITPEQWGASWAKLVSRIIAVAPGATIVPLIGTERLEDQDDDPTRVARYEAAMRKSLGPYADRVFPICESQLWTPAGGLPFDAPEQRGWLGDTIHRSPFGSEQVATHIAETLTRTGPQGPKGETGSPGSGFGVVNYLSQNQPLDPIIAPGLYLQGSTSGTSTTVGYPMNGFAGPIEVIGNNNTMTIQRATYFSASSSLFGVWVRSKFGSGAWTPWVRL